MERYIINVRFTEEEKLLWKKWNKHDYKFSALSCIPILIAFIGYNFTFLIYMTNRFNDPTVSAIDQYAPTRYTYTYEHTFDYMIMMPICIISNIVIIALIALFFKLISRIIMKKPDIMKQIIISVNSGKQTIDVQVLKVNSKRIIFEKSYTACEFIDYICSPKTNEIILDNVSYLIGTDRKTDIFSKEELKQYKMVHMPIKKMTTIESVSKIVELMRGVERCFDEYNRIYIDSYR